LPPSAPAAVTIRAQLRQADIDGLGHMNNLAYLLLMQEARSTLLDLVRTEEARYVVVRMEADYRREVRYADREVLVSARVAEVGRTSVTLEQELTLLDGTPAALGRVVLVAWSRSQRGARPIGADERAALLGRGTLTS